jgi:DNA-binding MarR family transcriptional regulator
VGETFEQEIPGASALATECVINVVATSQLIESLIAPELQARRVSMGGVNALEILRGAGTPLQPSVISERMLVTRGTVTSLIDTLERRGLVARTDHPSDRRKGLVDITDAGRALLEDFMPMLHRLERSWMAMLGERDQAELLRLLGRMAEGLEQRRVQAESSREVL